MSYWNTSYNIAFTLLYIHNEIFPNVKFFHSSNRIFIKCNMISIRFRKLKR
uniref:Uncharacterized protein n=1 Tax=Heterorhabditis bacteriophora TaxID=37862 RepID=A0A1I7WFB8_HETBA